MPGHPDRTRSLADALAEDARTTARLQLPARAGTTAPWPSWLDPQVREAYQRRGIDRPWRHQVLTAELAHAGRHVVVSTGTASGKSAAFGMPALTAALSPVPAQGGRGEGVLYLAPTKALAHDQLAGLRALGLPALRVGALDGDSSDDERAWARAHARWLVTNPDMLHRSILPAHDRWRAFLRSLRYVVVDEAHIYRGVFGAHVALVLRRLRRLAGLHGGRPTFVAASATTADPQETLTALVGAEVAVVDQDDSRRGRVELVLWRPDPPAPEAPVATTTVGGEPRQPPPGGLLDAAALVTGTLVAAGVSVLTFARSRRAVEVIAARIRDRSDVGHLVRAYRGGYLPEERRSLEQALRTGELRGLVATSALELGIDISGLDAVVLAGWPGTHSSFWQQVGRAGRTQQSALALLLAREDPLDVYIAEHPDVITGGTIEAVTLDPENPYVLAGHLCAAAAESPLLDAPGDRSTPDGDREAADLPRWFGPSAEPLCRVLAEGGMLRRRRDGWYWTQPQRPADLVDLRGSGGGPVRVVEAGTGRLLGTVDPHAAPASVHPGALYVHQGAVYEVLDLDLGQRVATAEATVTDLSTHALSQADVRIESTQDWRQWPDVRLCLGTVQISRQVRGYLVRRWPSGEVLAEHPLGLPATSLRTTAVWWEIGTEVTDGAGLTQSRLPGALHALEHAAIGVLPLVASCDRGDLGGLSTPVHPDVTGGLIVVHDGEPGGSGFAARGWREVETWLDLTTRAIGACRCEAGCPACVQSPACGNGNDPLDKAGAHALGEQLLAVVAGPSARPVIAEPAAPLR